MDEKNKEIYFEERSDGVEGKVIYKINPLIDKTLTKYFNLEFYGTKVKAPYYINTKKRKDLRALVGKGSPREMVLETKVWAQVKKFDLQNAEASEIRELMINVGIGIDCSGMVLNALIPFFKARGENLFRRLKYFDNSLRGRLARILRPVENVGANTLTSELNCKEVALGDVRPGDFIRGIGKQRNAYHITLVTEVVAEKGKDGQLENKSIKYTHSHRGYGDKNGVRVGEVIITDPDKSYLEQKWTEVHTDGRNYLYEDLIVKPEDCGFRRLRILGE